MPTFQGNLCYKFSGVAHLGHRLDSGHLIYKGGPTTPDGGRNDEPDVPGEPYSPDDPDNPRNDYEEHNSNRYYLNSWPIIVITWGASCKDIDTMSYWTQDVDNAVGWDYKSIDERGTYRHRWMGDDTDTEGEERIYAAIYPNWGAVTSDNRVYRVHVNAFGYDPDTYPDSSCKITVISIYGDVMSKTITASRRAEEKATVDDPYVTIRFDTNGRPTSIT